MNLAISQRSAAPRMPLSEVLNQWRDGDEVGWAVEFRSIRRDRPARLAVLKVSIIEFGILEPILLGSDGRIWDGHHRLCAAFDLGLTEVPVEHASARKVPA